MQYTVVLTSGTLNLRATPSTSGAVLASIPNYAVVTSILILPYVSENETADGRTWKSIEYNGQKGWAASEYLVSGNAVTPRENGILNPTTNINPQNSTSMFTLTEEMKKKLKIGAIVLGVGIAGFAVYKMTAGKKQHALPASTAVALSGVPRRKKRKTGKKSKKKTTKIKKYKLG